MIVDLIEAFYRLLWGDLFTLPVAGGIGISFMVVLLLQPVSALPCAPGCCRYGYSGI